MCMYMCMHMYTCPGADVYHAPPDSDRASFAAVVGSMDRWLGSYYSTVAAQQARKEVIVDMENLMIMQLRRFYELNNVAPHRIIFYRDGVGHTPPVQRGRLVLTTAAPPLSLRGLSDGCSGHSTPPKSAARADEPPQSSSPQSGFDTPISPQ